MMKKILTLFLAMLLLFSLAIPCMAGDATIDRDVPSPVEPAVASVSVTGKGCVLMEAYTGNVLFESESHKRLPPASVTKIMTLLLVMEAIDEGKIHTDDVVTASEHAASMGGTQIYLEVGEQMCVNDLIKAVAIPSANDAAVALAEFIAGSEDVFVDKMNARAAELGASDTHFTNCTGLFDDNDHFTTAYDLAVMTRELLKHPKIHEYSTVWMDSLRDGAFGLSNTNKLLRTYTGMNGMKTGYTSLAGHCLSGTAERNGMTLIAVTLGSPSSKDRFNDVERMLDYGFASYALADKSAAAPNPVAVTKGTCDVVNVEVSGSLKMLVSKGKEKAVETEVFTEPSLIAPVTKGQKVGYVNFILDGKIVKTCDVVASEDVSRAGFLDYFLRILKEIFA